MVPVALVSLILLHLPSFAGAPAPGRANREHAMNRRSRIPIWAVATVFSLPAVVWAGMPKVTITLTDVARPRLQTEIEPQSLHSLERLPAKTACPHQQLPVSLCKG